ncbi:MAG: iron-sulfur cluster assembly protein [Pseudaminobacter sp.]
MNALRERIEDALDKIIDPCSAGIGKPVGIATMGLVKTLDLKEDGEAVHVRLELRVTSPCCMMGPQFTKQAKENLLQLPGVASVEVEIAPEIDWTPAHMKASYRATLRGPRIGFPE